MIPSQRERTPVSPSEISKAVLEELKVELIISGKHLCVAKENESHQRYYEGYQKKAIQM